jgi:guanine deaminase
VLRDHEAVVVHCPDSNINVTAGLMPAHRLLDEGLSITLGSDIGGGHEVPICRAIARLSGSPGYEACSMGKTSE